MNSLAYKISSLSKKYSKKYNESVFSKRRSRKLINADNSKEFLALKDINLEIHKGDFIGLIGKNGAGKSTLLKILSGITESSSGEIEQCGKSASVLEIGMGFHPELSGRENIFLAGALLGFSKKEIQQIVPEIIDFSGIETFIDVPVKHYSSGMYIRLAFSVVAHINADILLFDEVLSIGDLEFQHKVAQKIMSFQGKTIIMASHNILEISRLCNKVLYLKDGEIRAFNDTENVLNLYIGDISSETSHFEKSRHFDQSNNFNDILEYNFSSNESEKGITLKKFSVRPVNGRPEDRICTSDALEFTVELTKTNDHSTLDIGLLFNHLSGLFMVSHLVESVNETRLIEMQGHYILKANFPANLFNDTIIYIGLSVSENHKNILFFRDDILRFKINKPDQQKESEYVRHFQKFTGPLKPRLNWSFEFDNSIVD